MLFSNVNLIEPSAAVRAVRQLVSQAIPAETRYGAPIPTDHEQILQAVALAAADLDASDPLLLPVTISAGGLLGQDSPALPNVGNQFIGTQLEALYMPAAIQPENLIPWAAGDSPSVIIPQAVITGDLLALIRWPRRMDRAVVSPYNGSLFHVDNIATANISLNGSGTGPDMDGQSPDNYGVCLLIGQTNPAQNGLYEFVTNSATYTLTRPGSSAWASQGSVFLIAHGAQYGGRYLQLTSANPITVDVTACTFSTLTTYPSNIDASEFARHILPRAAAYLAQDVVLAEPDKNRAAALSAWAAELFARPLPAATQAASQKLQTVSRYSHT
ncbi:MAG: hypothetical protein M1434_10320 [Chloroflexi bacterium]|nr:hypothetical protein [Chloroflexota bacterium]